MLKSKRVTLVFIIVMIIISVKLYNRERGLADVIDFRPNDFRSISTHNYGIDAMVNNKEAADELIEFFSQYRVKKVDLEAYQASIDRSKGGIKTFFIVFTHNKSRPILVQGNKSHVWIQSNKFYEVTNGQIDLDWIINFWERYGENIKYD